MKRVLVILFFLGFAWRVGVCEHLSVAIGRTSVNTNFWGVSLGGDAWHFLQIQLDAFKYMNKDVALSSPLPELSRGDFLGLSGNLVLKLPIHFLPKLDRLDFIQPYVSAGLGFGLESLNSEYLQAEDAAGKSGFLSKMRLFSSLGGGVIIMVIPVMGIKFDFRSLNVREHEGLQLPARRFNRFSFGICF